MEANTLHFIDQSQNNKLILFTRRPDMNDVVGVRSATRPADQPAQVPT